MIRANHFYRDLWPSSERREIENRKKKSQWAILRLVAQKLGMRPAGNESDKAWTKPSNGLGLRWVSPGLSLGWAGFIGAGSVNSFPGLGRAWGGQAQVTQRTRWMFRLDFKVLIVPFSSYHWGNYSPGALRTRTTLPVVVRSKGNALQMKIVWKKVYDLRRFECSWTLRVS